MNDSGTPKLIFATLFKSGVSLLAVAIILSVSACDYLPPLGQRSLVAETDPIALRLAESADKASSALQSLAKMEQGQKPPVPAETNDGAPPELMRHVTVDWSGPIEPLLQALAKQAGYTFSTIGRKPATPVVVRIDSINRPLIEDLRSASVQTSQTTDITVDANSKNVELSYVPVR